MVEDSFAFAEELEEFSLALSSFDALPDGREALIRVVLGLKAEYERLGMAAKMFGMDGVDRFATWVCETFLTAEDDADDAIEHLKNQSLINWLDFAAISMREPEDVSHLSELNSALLNSEKWSPLPPPEIVQSLLINLRSASVAGRDQSHSKTNQNPSKDTTENLGNANQDGHSSVDLSWDKDIHPELLDAYLQEAPMLIEQTATSFRDLVTSDCTDEKIQKAARLAHTVKGANAVAGVAAITSFTHSLEDILEYPICTELTNGLDITLIAAADCLEGLFENLKDGKPLPDDYAALTTELTQWKERLQALPSKPDKRQNSQPESEVPAQPPAVYELGDDINLSGREKTSTVSPPSKAASSGSLTVATESIQQLLNLTGELVTSNSRIDDYASRALDFSKRVQTQDEHIQQVLAELSETISEQHQLRLDKEKDGLNTESDQLALEVYNDLYSVYGLLNESVADSRALSQDLRLHINQLNDQIFQQQRLQRQLSEIVLKTRLVPIQSLVTRVERTVRETCRQTGKLAKVKVLGQNISLDTDILQNMSGPLMHLLRNAIDHGIETPEEREEIGKAKTGVLTLKFEQLLGMVHITLSDDGRGLDTQTIVKQAIKNKLITKDDKLSEEDIFRLTLRPGFSTREEINEISGRGVGLDVVQNAVENLQGSLELKSTAKQGTSIHIHLPLTLIATSALIVRVDQSLMAVPGNNITRLVYVSSGELIKNKQGRFIKHENETLKVYSLSALLGWGAQAANDETGRSMLLVDYDDELRAIEVDEILQPRDIVVKNISAWLDISRGIVGASILANGRISPVLDPKKLLRNAHYNTPKSDDLPPRQSKAVKTKLKNVLVIDDSLSNRKSLSIMVEQLGHTALTAVDGTDAMQVLNNTSVDLILADLEMPRMNGLELTRAVRDWREKKHLPILMITSRSTQKHRDQAKLAGVDVYLTKPVTKAVLDAQLGRWLSTAL